MSHMNSLFPNQSTSFSNINNNPNQPQPSSFGSSTGTGGGLFGNSQPSGGLFSNQTQQQQQQQPRGGGGSLFGDQVQQAQAGGLFGNHFQQQQQHQPQGGGGLFGGQVQQQNQGGSLFGGQSQGGSLFGGPQPSGGSFGGQVQQQYHGRGGLFSDQVQQQAQAQTGGLFGNHFQQQQQQQPQGGGGSLFGVQFQGGDLLRGQSQYQAQNQGVSFARHSITSSIPSNGTVNYIGAQEPNQLLKNKDNITLRSISAIIIGHSLEELRMADYFNLKNDRLNLTDKRKIIIEIQTNGLRLSRRYGSIPAGLPESLKETWREIYHLQFPSQPSPQNTQAVPTSGGLFTNPQPSTQNIQAVQSSGSLFMNKPPSQMALSPTIENNTLPTQPPETQSSSLTTQTPTAKQVKMKKASKKPKATTKSVNITSGSSPGSFSYEFNKMLFVSNLVQIMERHNMSVPENLLDNTDFVPQLLEFLGQHDVSLPTQDVPQFQINSVAPVETPESENNDEECDEY